MAVNSSKMAASIAASKMAMPYEHHHEEEKIDVKGCQKLYAVVVPDADETYAVSKL